MSSLTKWAAAVVAGVGLAFGGSADAKAADPVAPGYHHYPPRYDTDYVVEYRYGCHGPWRYYAKYETYHSALHAERRLRWEGYEVRVVPVREYHGPWRPF